MASMVLLGALGAERPGERARPLTRISAASASRDATRLDRLRPYSRAAWSAVASGARGPDAREFAPSACLIRALPQALVMSSFMPRPPRRPIGESAVAELRDRVHGGAASTREISKTRRCISCCHAERDLTFGSRAWRAISAPSGRCPSRTSTPRPWGVFGFCPIFPDLHHPINPKSEGPSAGAGG